MLNNQPPEKRVAAEASSSELDFISAWKTIQGEGPFAGMPAVFVRLAGCNLQCPWCDTNYTVGRQTHSTDEIVEIVKGIRSAGLVVLTGGEPFRQPIGPLCKQLILEGFQVQIETNGTMAPAHPIFQVKDAVAIVCSPKTPKINPQLRNIVTAWKYVLEAGKVDKDGLPSSALGGPRPARPPVHVFRDNVYLQPLDEGKAGPNKKNTEAVVASCLEHGYRLCLQTHKIVGLD